MEAVTDVLNKSYYGNSHLQMRQNLIAVSEHSGLCDAKWKRREMIEKQMQQGVTLMRNKALSVMKKLSNIICDTPQLNHELSMNNEEIQHEAIKQEQPSFYGVEWGTLRPHNRT